jgi:hypothetical protein
MRARSFGSVSTLAALAAAITVAANPASGQESRTTSSQIVVTAFGGENPNYEAPRTPWGDPDLQGVWSSDDATMPMSRPEQFGERLYLSGEEYAERLKQTKAGVDQSENDATSTFRFDFARRAFPQTSLIVDPPDGRMPEYTARGRARPMPRGTFGDGPLDWTNDFSLYERCITRGIAGSVLRVIYGNGNHIVQGPGTVAMTYEMLHDTRVFYTDGRPHVGSGIRSYLGDSRAHWEGDVLVVETTNLTDRTAIGVNGGGMRHSDQMTMTERFKRVADDVLQYQITFDDPVTYEQPFTLSFPLTPLDGGHLLPYDCHEGNFAILQSLGAERLEDRRLAEDRARGIDRPRRPIQDGLTVGGTPAGEGGGLFGRGRGAGPGAAAPEGDVDEP